MAAKLRLLALGAVVVLFLPCQGCFFSWLACTAGCRVDRPAVAEGSRSSIMEAYVSTDGARLALHYRTITLDRYPGCPFLAMGHPGPEGFLGTPGEAWVNVDADAVRRAKAGNPGANPPGDGAAAKPGSSGLLPEDCVSRRCRWPLKEMQRVDVVEVEADASAPDCPCPRVEVRADACRDWNSGHAPSLIGANVQVRWIKANPDADGPAEVVFDLPTHDYRKPAGYAALLLLPVTVPVDIVCWIPTLIVFAIVK